MSETGESGGKAQRVRSEGEESCSERGEKVGKVRVAVGGQLRSLGSRLGKLSAGADAIT